MLMLSRRRNESVRITLGDQSCIVTIGEIRGDKVRLAFTADKSVEIHREEVIHAIATERAPNTHVNTGQLLAHLQDLPLAARIRYLQRRNLAPARLTSLDIQCEICVGCGRDALRCQCHGDCVGRAAPANQSASPTPAEAACHVTAGFADCEAHHA